MKGRGDGSPVPRRVADGAGHEPFLFAAGDADQGRDWAYGFSLGAMLRDAAWAPLTRDRKAGMLLASIVALCGGDGDAEDEVSPEMRRVILERLPGIILAIAGFWRRARQQPVRSEKIGRNQPCPCGSGRKFKKCCGASPLPALH